MFSMYQGGTHVEAFDAGTTAFCIDESGDVTSGRNSSCISGTRNPCSSGVGFGAHESKSSAKSAPVRANAVSARGIQWRISDSRKTVNSMNKRKYESSAKGYVLQLENAFIETVQHSNTCKAQQLTQPMVCAQIYVEKPEDKFTIEFVFSEVETRRDRRRVVLSNAFMETKTSPLHCQVPIVAKRRAAKGGEAKPIAKNAFISNKKKKHGDESDFTRGSRNTGRTFAYGSWMNFIVPIPKLLKKCFGDAAAKQKYAIEKIRISGTCLIKRVMTLRGDRLSSGGFFGEDDYVPASVDFANGVDRKSILFLSEEEEGVGGTRSTKTAGVHEEGNQSPARKKQKDDDITPITTPPRPTYRERRQQNRRSSSNNAPIKSLLTTTIEAIDKNYEKLTKMSSRSPSPSPSPSSSFSSFSSTSSSRNDINGNKIENTGQYSPKTRPNALEYVEKSVPMISQSSSLSRSQKSITLHDEEKENDEVKENDEGEYSSDKLVSFLDVVPLSRTDLSVRVPNSRRSNLYRNSAEYRSSSESENESNFEGEDEKEDFEENGDKNEEQLPPSNWDAALGFSNAAADEA